METVRILGIDFYNGAMEAVLERVHRDGGLVVAPSGPGLAELGRNPHYDLALREADIVLIDSGYLAVLWRQYSGQVLQRHSGLKFIRALLNEKEFRRRRHSQLWVTPSPEATIAIRDYLREQGLALGPGAFYEAPFYDEPEVRDGELLARIRADRPDYVILCIAGGKQEVLGHWLSRSVETKSAIICIGGAIAFLTGQQARIPAWADRIYLGWLLRILSEPKVFLPRYWAARKLRHLVKRWKHAEPESSHTGK